MYLSIGQFVQGALSGWRKAHIPGRSPIAMDSNPEYNVILLQLVQLLKAGGIKPGSWNVWGKLQQNHAKYNT